MSRWLALIPLGVLAALGLLFSLYALRHDPQVTPMALVGKPMPDLVLASLDGAPPLRLREALEDGPVLVNFYASWCQPCAVEQPVLGRMKDAGVRIIGVAYKDKPAASRAFLAQWGNPYAWRVVDPEGRAGVEFGVTGPPETYLVDRSGVIRAKYVGELKADTAQQLIAASR